MNLTEIVKMGLMGVKPNEALTLVKNGYTAENIQELMTESNDQQENTSSEPSNEAGGTAGNETTAEAPEQQKDEQLQDEHITSDKDKKILELESALKKAQEENTRQAINSTENQKTIDEQVRDIVSELL